MEAWLTFLSSEEPEKIIELIEAYPDFRAMYQQVYEICQNVERVMEMFSKELREMDRNTVRYMIDEMQNEIDEKKEKLKQMNADLRQMNADLRQMDADLKQKDADLKQKDADLKQKEYEKKKLLERIAELESRNKMLEER